MKPYDPTAKCPKCGGDLIHTAHRDADGYPVKRLVRCEHMLRVCARCRYEWAEQALDAMSVEPRTDSALLVEMLRLRKQLDPGAPDAVALPTAEEQT